MLLLLFILDLSRCYADINTVSSNILYWDIAPYIFHDKSGKLTGIYVDLWQATQGGTCEIEHPNEIRIRTFVKKTQQEIEQIYDRGNITTDILFPMLSEPKNGDEEFYSSEGIAVIMLRNKLQMTVKFIFAFISLKNLFILTILCVVGSSFVMMVVVSINSFFTKTYNILFAWRIKANNT